MKPIQLYMTTSLLMEKVFILEIRQPGILRIFSERLMVPIILFLLIKALLYTDQALGGPFMGYMVFWKITVGTDVLQQKWECSL